VALARALFQQPEVLLLDEPFSALDTQRRERLEYELLSLQQSYTGDILFVTHDVAQGYKLGSRIAVFESGHIVQCDDKKKVIGSPINRTVATLTGMKNLIEGEINKIDDTSVWITIQELGQLKILNANGNHYTIKQHVTVGIRPEYIRLSNRSGENILPGVIERVVEGVASVDCYLSTHEKNRDGYNFEVKLTKSDAEGVSDGQSFNMFFPPEHLAIITNDPV
jgi:molybdate transport system ATP-binding protein